MESAEPSTFSLPRKTSRIRSPNIVPTHSFDAELWLPEKRNAVFSFFADARNLEAITPPWLNFAITTPEPIEIHKGSLIDYQLRIHGFPVRWQTEISGWNPPFGFVDKQLRGPYRQWIHTHTFEEKDGGTLCRDQVRYVVLGGRFIDWLIVRRDVARIFAYRREALLARFRKQPVSGPMPPHTRSFIGSDGITEPHPST